MGDGRRSGLGSAKGGLGIVQKAIRVSWHPDGGRALQIGIWDLKRKNTEIGRGRVGSFATGVFAQWEYCNARREVGILHNWTPGW